MTAHRTELTCISSRPALVTVWAHPSGRVDVEAEYLDTREREHWTEYPCGQRITPKRTAPNPLGVAIVLGLALALIAWGLVLAFGDGNGWWAALAIAGGTVLIGRVLDVREARR